LSPACHFKKLVLLILEAEKGVFQLLFLAFGAKRKSIFMVHISFLIVLKSVKVRNTFSNITKYVQRSHIRSFSKHSVEQIIWNGIKNNSFCWYPEPLLKTEINKVLCLFFFLKQSISDIVLCKQ
jgi:hypothetical protein